jgi:hypothetical protein
MPIVITPQGEYINSETGNPVNLPPQRPDLRVGSGSALTPEEIEILSRQRTGASLTPQEKNMYSQLYQKNMARENIPANMDMGMDSMMPQTMGQQTGAALTPEEMQVGLANRSGSALTEGEMDDVAKVQYLVDMGLSPADAMEAVAREKMSQVNPSAFGGNAESPNPGMGALSGVQAGNEIPMSMPTPRPEDLMMRQMPSGRDRTFNPNDPINRYNAPNT